MKLIPLTQGKFALVDDAEAGKVLPWKWYAQKDKNTFYAKRCVRKPDGTRMKLQMHRVIMGITNHSIQVDHRSGNGLDNRRSNLRVATHGQNQRNAAKRKDNTSGMRGVGWNKHAGKWQARIRANGKRIHLGYFTDIAAAKAARTAAELKYHGQFSAVLSRKKPAQSVTNTAYQKSALT